MTDSLTETVYFCVILQTNSLLSLRKQVNNDMKMSIWLKVRDNDDAVTKQMFS